jgi:hypothetical protein
MHYGLYERPIEASFLCVLLTIRREFEFRIAPFRDGCLITGRVVRYESTLDSY